jgi:hypothetical protein
VLLGVPDGLPDHRRSHARIARDPEPDLLGREGAEGALQVLREDLDAVDALVPRQVDAALGKSTRPNPRNAADAGAAAGASLQSVPAQTLPGLKRIEPASSKDVNRAR